MKNEIVLIVTEEPLMRLGLRHFLLHEMGLKLCVEAGNFTQALKQQAEHEPALVILFFCEQAQAETVRLVRELRRRRRQQAVLVVARTLAREHVQECIASGALGYVRGADGLAELRLACTSVLRGDLHVTQEAARALQRVTQQGATRKVPLEVLTLREREVLALMGRGVKGVDLAAQLGISVKTVETHQKHLREKLELKNITELWLLAGGEMRDAVGR